MYRPEPFKFKYDTEAIPLQECIRNILGVDDIEQIHNIEKYDFFERSKDQGTIWHEKYYQSFENEFHPLYLTLLEHIQSEFGYEDELIYQKIPTFRVQLGDGNIAVGEWHKDKTYNHGSSEVNFWLPFVDTNDTNTIHMESKEDLGDYKPYTVNYGEVLVFDGANLMHGNVENTSGKTRVSIDFRLVDPKRFVPSAEGSINMNTTFDIGGYFDVKGPPRVH